MVSSYLKTLKSVNGRDVIVSTQKPQDLPEYLMEAISSLFFYYIFILKNINFNSMIDFKMTISNAVNGFEDRAIIFFNYLDY